MPAKSVHYADQRNDAFQLVADLCHVPGRHDSVWSRPGTKAEAYSYRQRIYRWRRTVLALLAHHDSPEAQKCLDNLRPAMGIRFCKDWLDYTRFDVEEVPLDPPIRYKFGELPPRLYRVRGSVSTPMYGPDLVFADNPEHIADVDAMRELLDLATLTTRIVKP